jgi:small subunit ribosomal protein S2
MSETTVPPSAAGDTPAAAAAPAGEETAAAIFEKTDLSIRALLEAGAHFGHQTHRWNPLMRPHIFGARNGTHILDLDQTLPNFVASLDHIRETVSNGGSVLFVGTKRQAADVIRSQAERGGQYYVNNRWLGGMLTNWKTVKKSIDTYKNLLAIQADEEKRAEHSKKELARMSRLCQKYDKSLAGIKNMPRVPDVIFIVDVGKEAIAISEARRLAIPIIGIVDSNRDPRNIDYVVPGNDDATRAIDLYCKCVADACIEGEAMRQDKLVSQKEAEPKGDKVLPGTGRRVVEITQPARRTRGQGGGAGGTTGSGRTQSAGGWSDKRAGEGAEASKTEGAKAEATKTEATKPEATKPEATKSEATKPEATKPETTKPETTKPETKKAEPAETKKAPAETEAASAEPVSAEAAPEPAKATDADKD